MRRVTPILVGRTNSHGKKEAARKLSESASFSQDTNRQRRSETSVSAPSVSPTFSTSTVLEDTLDTHPIEATPPLEATPISRSTRSTGLNDTPHSVTFESAEATPPTPATNSSVPQPLGAVTPASSVPTPQSASQASATTKASTEARQVVSPGERVVWDLEELTEDLEKCGTCFSCSRGEIVFLRNVKEMEDEENEGVCRVVLDFMKPSHPWVKYSVQFERELDNSCVYFKNLYHALK